MKMTNEYRPNYVVFDIETTGFDREHDSITEIAAIRVRNHEAAGEFSSLVKPFKRIPDEVVNITNITNEMVETAPPMYKVIKKFLDFVGNDYLVGHNIKSFDLPFIANAVKNCGMKGYIPNEYGIQLNNLQYADSCLMSRELLPGQSHKLGDLAEFYGISNEGAHRALNDVYMNFLVFEKMMTKEKELGEGIQMSLFDELEK